MPPCNTPWTSTNHRARTTDGDPARYCGKRGVRARPEAVTYAGEGPAVNLHDLRTLDARRTKRVGQERVCLFDCR